MNVPKSSSETTGPVMFVASESSFDIILYPLKRDKALCLSHLVLVSYKVKNLKQVNTLLSLES